MRFSNHKPSTLDAARGTCPITGDFAPEKAIKGALVDALYEPLVQGAPATLTINGEDVSPDQLTALLVANAFDPTVDVDRDKLCREILHEGLVYYDKDATIAFDASFAIQAACKENAHCTPADRLDYPNDLVIYTPVQDIIPTATQYIAGMCSLDRWFATLAFFARDVETFGATFCNEQAFDQFKEWVANQVQQLSANMPPETVRLFNEFDKLTLGGLTESIIVRKDAQDNNDEMSFARMLPRMMLDYTAQQAPPIYGLLPFSLSQLIVPETIVFVNAEAHKNAKPQDIHKEWTMIGRALATPVRVISPGKLSKLTTAARAAQKMAGRAATAHMLGADAATRALKVRFRQTPPTQVDLVKMVKKVLSHMGNVQRSQNCFKTVKPSFMRPNRRDPDNFNLKGQASSTQYKPDIHLYVDTSGSISEKNYQDTVMACIALARKLNVNLYFNSFSHVLSTCTFMPVKGRSIAQIYKQFQNIDKVGGGTDYEQIWRYIQASPRRKREFSLIITDFEYTAPSRYTEHPENLYYAPCSQMNWDYITSDAQKFCSSMRHIDPLVRRKILI